MSQLKKRWMFCFHLELDFIELRFNLCPRKVSSCTHRLKSPAWHFLMHSNKTSAVSFHCPQAIWLPKTLHSYTESRKQASIYSNNTHLKKGIWCQDSTRSQIFPEYQLRLEQNLIQTGADSISLGGSLPFQAAHTALIIICSAAQKLKVNSKNMLAVREGGEWSPS